MVKFTQEKMSCVWLLWTCTKRPQQGTNTEMHIAHIQPYPLPPDAKVTPPQAGQPLGSPDAVRLLSSLLHRHACTFPLSLPVRVVAQGIGSKITCSCLSLNSAAILLEEWPLYSPAQAGG